MTIRLVATDLDGTFFGADHRPSTRASAAVNALAERDVVIAAVTGRSWFTGIDYATSTGAHLDWFIGANGGHRVDPASREVHERLVFDADEITAALATIRAELPDIGIATEHQAGQCRNPELLAQLPVDDGFHRYPSVEFRPDDIGKVLLVQPETEPLELLAQVRELAGPSMVVTSSGIRFVEITPSGADKGSALARLCSLLDIDRTEVVAFGDNHNDLTMLEWAGRGVAMGNAEAAVKAVADEVTETNVDDGVARVLETLV